VLLIWVYYSAQIFLLGAEFTWVYAHRHGSRRGTARPATTKATAATTEAPHGAAAPVPDAPATSPAEDALLTRAAPPLATPPLAAPPGPRMPAPAHRDGLLAFARRHPGAAAGAALLLGAVAGGLVNVREARKPRSRLMRMFSRV
jgi:hypothetical protein